MLEKSLSVVNFFVLLLIFSYFALAGIMRLFRYLHYGLAALLVFVGKMLFTRFPWQPLS